MSGREVALISRDEMKGTSVHSDERGKSEISKIEDVKS